MEEYLKLAIEICAGPAPKSGPAFMGMGEGFERPTARICYRCPDRKTAERDALAKGYDLSHGLCSGCLRIEIEENAEHLGIKLQ